MKIISESLIEENVSLSQLTTRQTTFTSLHSTQGSFLLTMVNGHRKDCLPDFPIALIQEDAITNEEYPSS